MKYFEEMIVVPGYAVRREEDGKEDAGTLIGYRCPISKRTYTGPTAERDQYRMTKSLMIEHGSMTASIAEYRAWYVRTYCR